MGFGSVSDKQGWKKSENMMQAQKDLSELSIQQQTSMLWRKNNKKNGISH
jgi:hypothetical protein